MSNRTCTNHLKSRAFASSLLTTVIAVLWFACSAGAFTLELSGAGPLPDNARLKGETTLYTLDAEGREIAVAKTGDTDSTGFQFDDLGYPSVADDGTVWLAAASYQHHAVNWRIFSVAPNALNPVRLAGSDHFPEMRTDPQPIPDGTGGIVFAVSSKGHDDLFRFSNGELLRVAGTGSRTRDGRTLRHLTFGTIAATGDRAAFTGWLDGDIQAEILVQPEGIVVLAAANDGAPDGRRFIGNGFGLPALVASTDGGLAAFSARTAAGDGLFLYRNGKLKRVLTVEGTCAHGRLNYVSRGRPGLLDDGSVAVLGGCSGEDEILTASRAGVMRSRLRPRSDDSGKSIGAFGDPIFAQAGTLFFQATGTDGTAGIYELHPDNEIGRLAPAIRLEPVSDERKEQHSHDGLFVSPSGHVAYLGTP